jgi:hypothetical protein
MVTTVALRDLTDAEVEDWHGDIVHVYRRAFGAPPYNKGEVEVTGFAYGYISRPGQFWYDTVATAFGPHAADEWLTRSFQLVEIAVAPPRPGTWDWLPSARSPASGNRIPKGCVVHD